MKSPFAALYAVDRMNSAPMTASSPISPAGIASAGTLHDT
jgi:hypothetical protein